MTWYLWIAAIFGGSLLAYAAIYPLLNIAGILDEAERRRLSVPPKEGR